MVKLMIQVTPPRPGDRSAIMSTQEWIQHPERRSALKRHSSITFTPQKQKKLRYEPRDEGTETILEYHAKNEASHQDRDVIGVTYPFDEILEESKKRYDELRNDVKVCIPRSKSYSCIA